MIIWGVQYLAYGGTGNIFSALTTAKTEFFFSHVVAWNTHAPKDFKSANITRKIQAMII
jgi:hypothetical protein